MKAAPILTSFNAGALSPLLDGRVDLAKYFSGAKMCRNFIGSVQGPAVRRGGTRFVLPVKDESKRAWLIKFEFSATQCYYLEFGDLYVRFFTSHGVLLSGGVPYEIVSPYALADLTNADGSCALSVVQSGDVLYIANAYRTYAPRKLTRVGNTNWVFSTYAPNQGPFIEQNTGATTIISSADVGAVTLTASAALFAASDVGRLVRLDALNLDTKPWQTGLAYVATDRVRSDGKTYVALNAATSGTAPPVHERGNAYDGKTGVQWTYVNSGYGIARITAFTDSTHVSATVVTDASNGLSLLPIELVSVATTRWQLGAWSATTEYPAVVTFFRNRLWWFGKQRIWGSVPDDFENMAADFFNEVRADNAVARIMAAKDVNDILWAVGADKLIIGTGGGEFVAGEITTTEPLGPGNFEIVPQSGKRVRSVAPVIAGSSVLYVQRAGRKLMSLNYSFDVDKYSSTDLAVLSNRITRTGIVAMAFQGEPWSINWSILGNGQLLSFTYDQEQQVTGWGQHPIGGAAVVVESIASGPTPDGSREEVWMIVRRTINGATHRYVEFMEQPWEGPGEDELEPGDAQEDAFYVDSGLTYRGAPATVISGLNHLEGQTVQILADGARQPDKTVSSGSITLDRAASVVQAGLQFISRLVPMRLEAGAKDGTAQGKLKRIHKLVIRFVDTLGGRAGEYKKQLDDIAFRSPSTPMGQPQPIFSGDFEMQFPGDWGLDGFVEIRQDGPLPMTVAALMPQMQTSP